MVAARTFAAGLLRHDGWGAVARGGLDLVVPARLSALFGGGQRWCGGAAAAGAVARAAAGGGRILADAPGSARCRPDLGWLVPIRPVVARCGSPAAWVLFYVAPCVDGARPAERGCRLWGLPAAALGGVLGRCDGAAWWPPGRGGAWWSCRSEAARRPPCESALG